MKYNRHPISYQGNKYLETNRLLKDNLIKNINDYNYIVEPFCGIYGFTRAIFNKYNIDDYNGKILLNDINPLLIQTLKMIRDDYGKFQKINNNFYNELLKQEDKRAYIKKRIENRMYELEPYIIYITFTQGNFFRDRLIEPLLKKINDEDNIKQHQKILSKCELFNMDNVDFYNYINKLEGKKLMYFDPPYLFCAVDTYKSLECMNDKFNDTTSLYVDIINYFNNDNNNSLLMVVNKVDLFHYLMNKYEIKKYNKTYANTLQVKNIKTKEIKLQKRKNEIIVYGKNL